MVYAQQENLIGIMHFLCWQAGTRLFSYVGGNSYVCASLSEKTEVGLGVELKEGWYVRSYK